jgi:uncharacterized protein YjiS (DUF1127 family)
MILLRRSLALPSRRSYARSHLPQSVAAVLEACTRLFRLVAEVRTVLRVWRQRARYRRDLARLRSSGPHLIEDIGLSQAEANREAAKPFWRP